MTILNDFQEARLRVGLLFGSFALEFSSRAVFGRSGSALTGFCIVPGKEGENLERS